MHIFIAKVGLLRKTGDDFINSNFTLSTSDFDFNLPRFINVIYIFEIWRKKCEIQTSNFILINLEVWSMKSVVDSKLFHEIINKTRIFSIANRHTIVYVYIQTWYFRLHTCNKWQCLLLKLKNTVEIWKLLLFYISWRSNALVSVCLFSYYVLLYGRALFHLQSVIFLLPQHGP